MIKHWTPQELTALRRIRERFLNGTAGAEDYWRVPADVAMATTFGGPVLESMTVVAEEVVA